MDDGNIFLTAGFDPSLAEVFCKLRSLIEEPEGCNAKVYKPTNMRQARAAHIAPGEAGTKARKVFLMISPRKKGMALERRRQFRAKKPKDQYYVKMDNKFSDWNELSKTLKEWSLDPVSPKKPKHEIEFGDGHALPGGLPETNRSKF